MLKTRLRFFILNSTEKISKERAYEVGQYQIQWDKKLSDTWDLNDPKLNRAVEKAIQVAPTDISVLVTGESGVGKESIPKIIHSLSHRKHGKYIAVNCGAIPAGTIDSQLFGHENSFKEEDIKIDRLFL